MQWTDEGERPILRWPLSDIFKSGTDFSGIYELILGKHYIWFDLHPVRKCFVFPVMLPDRFIVLKRLRYHGGCGREYPPVRQVVDKSVFRADARCLAALTAFNSLHLESLTTRDIEIDLVGDEHPVCLAHNSPFRVSDQISGSLLVAVQTT